VTASLPLPADEDLPDDVREVLASLPPLNVFRAVAGVPASFRPFMQLGGSLLGGPEIDARNREIAILAVARATNAAYERAQHEQLGRNVGIADEEIAAIRDGDAEAVLDEDGALAFRAATEISENVRLSDATLERLIERWGNAGAAELILCCSYYNMVSRFLESARVPLEDEELLGLSRPDQLRKRP
jgi:alkylhydroperoxidase family enzyme